MVVIYNEKYSKLLRITSQSQKHTPKRCAAMNTFADQQSQKKTQLYPLGIPSMRIVGFFASAPKIQTDVSKSIKKTCAGGI